MRMSQLFTRCRFATKSKTPPKTSELIQRAGFHRSLGTDAKVWLPPGMLVLDRIQKIIRTHFAEFRATEVAFPLLLPQALTSFFHPALPFIRQSNGMIQLQAFHLAAAAMLADQEIRSYRQLPTAFYATQTVLPAIPSSEVAKVMNLSEFFYFDSAAGPLEAQYHRLIDHFEMLLKQWDLPFKLLRSEANQTCQFIISNPNGDRTRLSCSACDYCTDTSLARTPKTVAASEPVRPLQKVATPGTKTIAELATFLNIPESRTAKALFRVAEIEHEGKRVSHLLIAIVRGDLDVDEFKLARAIKALSLRPAEETEIMAIDAVPGYASPIGLKKVLIVVDDLIPQSTNLVAGANIEGFHFLNTNYERDYRADVIADITRVQPEDLCPVCGNTLQSENFNIIAQVATIGAVQVAGKEAGFINNRGKFQPHLMNYAYLDLEQFFFALGEVHRDERGFCWPVELAPFQVYLIQLSGKENAAEVTAFAEQIYENLTHSRLTVLFDDRNETPGIKFTDADLLGIPVRITVSQRSLQQGGVEVKLRKEPDKHIVAVDEVKNSVQAFLLPAQTPVIN